MTDDLISRQETIDAVCDDWCGYKNSQCPHPFKPEEDEYYWCDGCYSVECIKNLPSAQPERKKGEWKPFDLTWGRSVYSCTACGEAMDIPTEMSKPIYRFCPNCGARMGVE